MSPGDQGRAIFGETLEAYAERMKTINISDCPTDFQEAFIRLRVPARSSLTSKSIQTNC